MIRSLQQRLLIGMAAGSTIVLLAACVLLYFLIRSALIAGFDDTLASEAHALTTLVEHEDGRILTEMAEHGIEKFQPDERPLYYQLWHSDGRSIERSLTLGTHNLDANAGTIGQPRFLQLPNDRAGRSIAVHFYPHLEAESSSTPEPPAFADQLTLVVARETRELESELGKVRAMLIAVFAAALVMTLLVTAPIVHRGLRPLRNTAMLIELVDSRTLGTRLEVASAPAEIVPIIERLNELLDRLNQAFRREREFSSNVAHELRTPLTGLRTTIEVALSSQRDPAGYQRSLATCLEICRQTQCVIENLLSLARVDAGACKVYQERADVNALIHDTWTAFAMRAASRQLRVVWRNEPRLVVSVDVEKLRLILMNLFDNAVSYCDTGGEIEVSTHASDGELVFQIANTGSQVAQHDVGEVLERFWRGDVSRSDTGTHAGLGLALCREFCEVLHGSIEVRSASGERFEVRIAIPVQSSASEVRDIVQSMRCYQP